LLRQCSRHGQIQGREGGWVGGREGRREVRNMPSPQLKQYSDTDMGGKREGRRFIYNRDC